MEITIKIDRRIFLKVAGASLCAGAASPLMAGSRASAKTTKKPNIIYILADDLGYGDLSCYGQQKFKTPNIDRLAAEGMKFAQHYSGSTVCAPSRFTLMTGKNHWEVLMRARHRDPDLRPGAGPVGPLRRRPALRPLAGGRPLGRCGRQGPGQGRLRRRPARPRPGRARPKPHALRRAPGAMSRR